MKKKILFVAWSLGSGGAEKALVNLLHMLDYDKYDVSLQLFENYGINLAYLPDRVKLLPALNDRQWLLRDVKTFAVNAGKKGRPDLLVSKLLGSLKPIAKRCKSQRYKTLCAWKAIRRAFPKTDEAYDVAIAYIQGLPIYYVVDCVNAGKKIGWMHIDFSKIDDTPHEELLEYYSRLDAFVSMSQRCVEELQSAFPSIREKICLLHNLNSIEMIEELSRKEPADDMPDDGKPILLSIGRLCAQKGFDLAIRAAEILKAQGTAFRWYVLGVGELEASLRQTVLEKGLGEDFVFLGIRANPYPYILKATIVVQTSRYEGKSVVLDEAKILKKPILVTNYNSVSDQIVHGKSGYVVEIDAEAIAEGLTELLQNDQLRQQLIDGLSDDVRREQEYWLNKHYELFER